MTEDIEQREIWIVMATYKEATQGTVSVPARDKDHAIELATNYLTNHEDVKIVDAVRMNDIKQMAGKELPTEVEDEDDALAHNKNRSVN